MRLIRIAGAAPFLLAVLLTGCENSGGNAPLAIGPSDYVLTVEGMT